MDKNNINDMENIKKQISETKNIAIIINDSLAYRIENNMDSKPLLSLLDLLSYKLKLIEDDYEYLLSRLK